GGRDPRGGRPDRESRRGGRAKQGDEGDQPRRDQSDEAEGPGHVWVTARPSVGQPRQRGAGREEAQEPDGERDQDDQHGVVNLNRASEAGEDPPGTAAATAPTGSSPPALRERVRPAVPAALVAVGACIVSSSWR